MHTDNPPQWHNLFQTVGHTFRRPMDEKRDPKRPKYVTGWNGKASGFFMVSKMPRQIDMFLVEVKTHFQDGFLNFETRVRGSELAVLANIPNRDTDIKIVEVDTARLYDAEFHVPGVCLRRADEVVLLLPDKRHVHYGASIQAKDFFVRDMNRMLRFGRVDVKSECEI